MRIQVSRGAELLTSAPVRSAPRSTKPTEANEVNSPVGTTRKAIKAAAAVIAVAGLIMSACGSESTSGSLNVEGALTVRRFSALPVCWFGERGTVYFVSDTEMFFYCDGRNYVALDLAGIDGIDGVSWVVSVSEAPADLCPAGGALVAAGPDEDRDGTADEVTSGQPVCNGIDGQDGADGQDGGSCSVSTDESGTVTIACDDGTVATIPSGDGSAGNASNSGSAGNASNSGNSGSAGNASNSGSAGNASNSGNSGSAGNASNSGN